MLKRFHALWNTSTTKFNMQKQAELNMKIFPRHQRKEWSVLNKSIAGHKSPPKMPNQVVKWYAHRKIQTASSIEVSRLKRQGVSIHLLPYQVLPEAPGDNLLEPYYPLPSTAVCWVLKENSAGAYVLTMKIFWYKRTSWFWMSPPIEDGCPP